MLDVTRRPIIPRQALIDRILSRPEPVLVLEAPAGMGKSTLLAEIARQTGRTVHVGETPPAIDGDEQVLWDVPPGATPTPLPEHFASGGRIIIAKRTGTVLPGLARAAAYGYTAMIRPDELLFTRDELAAHFDAATLHRVIAETGGWPLLVSCLGGDRQDDAMMREFLMSDILRPLPSADLVNLDALMNGKAVPNSAELPLPFAQRDRAGRLSFTVEAIRAPLAAALAAVLAERLQLPGETKAIAEAHVALGQLTEAILTFQQAGFYELALRAFAAADGQFFIYMHGPKAFDRVLDGFPTSFAMQSETIVMSLALQALKRGDVSLARRLLVDRYGDAANDIDAVFSPRSLFSRDFRAFRHLMLIYEDVFFTEDLLERVFAMLAEFPPQAHFQRGSFYNCVLEFYMRRRRFAEAEDVALRARYHYEQAHSPMLTFYIVLHQAIMRLMMGDAITARKHAADAAQCLHRVPFESPSDARLVTLLNACVDYEGGKAEPLARFLSLELDDFAHGEIWPSLIEFALLYGSQALSEHFSTIAARSFLDRWRVYQIRNRQFGAMIEIREAAVLQNGNRWQEAAEKLLAIDSRIGRAWVQSATEELARLVDRDEIGLTLIWLRHLVHEMPTRPGLEAQLTAMLGNLHLTERQRIGIEIWLAYVHKRQRNLSKARALLQKTFERAARLGAVAPLTEERVFLAELIEHQRIGEFLDASGPVRQILRRLRESGLPSTAITSASGLSRRETRILLMISEGAANKFIANALGLSEATVKFHLGNVYRKLGCKKRREAISAARALGMVR
jgi:ATP/maltotriose-dependent transcriptional regulator MalT